MNTYSIKDLEHISGIKAHTLRIWEQRYNFIKPKRTETNIRYYNGEDLKLILNIAALKENGYKISKIAKMPVAEISEEVSRLNEGGFRYSEQVQALSLSMLHMDEERFEKIIATSILQLGFEKTMLHIIYPFLEKVGMLWQTGAASPAHEHFITNLIRQKLMVAIDGQCVRRHDRCKKYLLFLPEEEMHEIGLLFASYIIKARNHQVIYLGQSLPFDSLRSIFEDQKPDFLMTILTNSSDGTKIEQYINELAMAFPSATLLVSGRQIVDREINFSPNTVVFPRKELFIEFVDRN